MYLATPGPCFETPAEIRAFRTLGATLVGMSTVPETIVARHMGIEVLGVSCVTNLAAGLGATQLSHEEVSETGKKVEKRLAALITRLVPRIAAAAGSGQVSETDSSPRLPFPPVVLGIAGCSGSGKTTLAAELAHTLGGIHFHLDNYYLDLGHMPYQRAHQAELRRSCNDRELPTGRARGGAGARRDH